MSISHCTFCVTSPRLDVRLRKSLVESSASFPTRSRFRTQTKKTEDDERPGDDQERAQDEVVVGRQNPDDQCHQPSRRQDRPDHVERASRVGRQRIMDTATEQDDEDDHDGLKDEGGASGDDRGDESPDQGTGGGADPAHAADDAERLGPGSQIVEEHGGEDVRTSEAADELGHGKPKQHPP